MGELPDCLLGVIVLIILAGAGIAGVVLAARLAWWMIRGAWGAWA